MTSQGPWGAASLPEPEVFSSQNLAFRASLFQLICAYIYLICLCIKKMHFYSRHVAKRGRGKGG